MSLLDSSRSPLTRLSCLHVFRNHEISRVSQFHEIEPARNKGPCTTGHDGPWRLSDFERHEQVSGPKDFNRVQTELFGDLAFDTADI